VIGVATLVVAATLGWSSPLGGEGRWGAPVLLGYGADGGRRAGLHTGVDLQAPCGTPVLAIADGEVVAIGRDFVTLSHVGTGLFSRVDHLARVDVRLGPIARGRRVGLVGRGEHTSCHVHLALRIGRAPETGYTGAHPMVWGYVPPSPGALRGGSDTSDTTR